MKASAALAAIAITVTSYAMSAAKAQPVVQAAASADAGIQAARHGRAADAKRLITAYLAQPNPDPAQAGEAVNALLTIAMAKGNYDEAAALWLSLDPALKAQFDDDTRSNGDVVLALRGQPAPSVERRTATVHAGRDMADMVRIDANFGNAPVNAVIDTGADLSVVTESLAERAGYHIIADPIEGTGSTGATVHGRLAVGDISVGDTVFHNAVMVVLPDADLTFSPQYKIDAILGFPQLAGVGRVQFGEDYVIFAAPQTGEGAASFELRKLSIYVAGAIDGAPALFHLDTGNNSTDLGPNAAPMVSRQLASAQFVATRVGGAGGVVETQRATLKDVAIRIGDAEAVLDVSYAPDNSTFSIADDAQGRLGQDFLRRFASYTVDFDAMTLQFEPK